MDLSGKMIYLVTTILVILQSYFAEAGIYCGNMYCTGSEAYCCYGDIDQCCWHTIYVYELWWFWVLWFIGLMFIISCVICIRRRRLAERQRYIRVGEPYVPQVYGTTSVTTTQYAAPPPPAYGTVVPNAPYPDTAPAYQQPYPQSNQNYGKPPSYQ